MHEPQIKHSLPVGEIYSFLTSYADWGGTKSSQHLVKATFLGTTAARVAELVILVWDHLQHQELQSTGNIAVAVLSKLATAGTEIDPAGGKRHSAPLSNVSLL